jgi:tetratricopeptide (TPR) repeat protein
MLNGKSSCFTKFAALACTCLAMAVPVLCASSAPQTEPSEDLQRAEHGVSLLMDADIDGSIQVFRQIQASDPSSPLGYVLEADATWWKIYLSTGNLIDPDVFDVASSQSTPYDANFDKLIDVTILKAEENVRAGNDVARNELYEGLAYALRGRLLGMRGKDLPTAKAGKKMRELLMEAIAKDPSLVDADLGLGIYNYFVDTLPGIVKLLRWAIGLPGGSRIEGLQQLQNAAEHGPLTSGEAYFYLGKDYSLSSEKQYEKSLQSFQQLARQYPDNGLWKLLSGSVEIRLGHRQEGEQLYKNVFDQTKTRDSVAYRALHRASRLAIKRMDPEVRLGG